MRTGDRTTWSSSDGRASPQDPPQWQWPVLERPECLRSNSWRAGKFQIDLPTHHNLRRTIPTAATPTAPLSTLAARFTITLVSVARLRLHRSALSGLYEAMGVPVAWGPDVDVDDIRKVVRQKLSAAPQKPTEGGDEEGEGEEEEGEEEEGEEQEGEEQEGEEEEEEEEGEEEEEEEEQSTSEEEGEEEEGEEEEGEEEGDDDEEGCNGAEDEVPFGRLGLRTRNHTARERAVVWQRHQEYLLSSLSDTAEPQLDRCATGRTRTRLHTVPEPRIKTCAH